MLKRAFEALKADDRVTVTGTQDYQEFDGEVGTVLHVNNKDALIRFDTWSNGHGVGDHEWHFERGELKNFNIKPFVAPVVTTEPKPRKRPHGAQEYKGNGKHNWEKVTGDTMRLRVPGGWLYGIYSDRIHRVVQTQFVPVPQAVGYAV
jgi:hypothetical protein